MIWRGFCFLLARNLRFAVDCSHRQGTDFCDTQQVERTVLKTITGIGEGNLKKKTDDSFLKSNLKGYAQISLKANELFVTMFKFV